MKGVFLLLEGAGTAGISGGGDGPRTLMICEKQHLTRNAFFRLLGLHSCVDALAAEGLIRDPVHSSRPKRSECRCQVKIRIFLRNTTRGVTMQASTGRRQDLTRWM